jgi:hypothetical protein
VGARFGQLTTIVAMSYDRLVRDIACLLAFVERELRSCLIANRRSVIAEL